MSDECSDLMLYLQSFLDLAMSCICIYLHIISYVFIQRLPTLFSYVTFLRLLTFKIVFNVFYIYVKH